MKTNEKLTQWSLAASRSFTAIRSSLLLASAIPLVATTAVAQVCEDTTWDLWAGQTNNVGSVTVSNDQDNVYITYTLDYQDPNCPDGAVEAEFGTLHLWVGETLETLPRSNGGPNDGAPIPGQFPYKSGDALLPSADGLQTYTFTVPFAELGITGATDACGASLFIVTHAEVRYLDCDGNPTGEGDTAFGGDTPGNGPRWWYYGEYVVCCDDGPPPPIPYCETAFAKGSHVWTMMRKANPEELPSLDLTRARWGWAINLTAPGETEYEIWAGAGLNDTDKGVLAGTLTLSWDGTDVEFCYNLAEGFSMEELHFDAGDAPPTTIAPGQYSYIQDFGENNVPEWCGTVSVADTGDDGVWIIAHAVVCFEQ